jgi:1-acyl-sn-glycerol-3-phosphate acyltransferase
MVHLRSAIYQVAFVLNLAAFTLVFAPLFALPRVRAVWVMQLWARTSGLLLRAICGLSHEVRGARHVPAGAALVAAKHQSAWETLALLHILPDPAVVQKQEVERVPVFGAWARRFGHLSLDRAGGGVALRRLIGAARGRAAEGRQILIFPEGTRRPPGAPAAYQRGVVALYRALGTPCVPVALNSGLYWPRNSFLRRPGRIVVEFLAPIPPGLDGAAFLAELEARIETATAALVEEGREPA